MSRKPVQVLLAVAIALGLLLLVLRGTDDNDTTGSGRPLLPGFRAVANDLEAVNIVLPEAGEPVSLLRQGDDWVVASRSDYPASMTKLRQLIIALADANIIEDKTSQPERYAKLGVADPDSGGNGTKLMLAGPDVSYAVIFGNAALADYRYARIADDATSHLIDTNPELPGSAGEWLLPDIVDIAAADVRRVTIEHSDGERIVIEKSEREQTDFTIADIPDGREPSYAAVGNGVAGALSNLELEDVRPATDAAANTTTVFETWDGLRVTVELVEDGDTSWVSLAASGGDETDPERAAGINSRVGGWQYRIADYKRDLLARRWDDLLKAAD